MTEYEKEEFLTEVELFFLNAKNEQGLPVPYSNEGIVDSLNQVGWDYLREHWDNAQEEETDEISESMNVLFNFSHKVVLAEVTRVALELEKKGEFNMGVDKNGEITFIKTNKDSI